MKLLNSKFIFIFLCLILLYSCNKQSALPPDIETTVAVKPIDSDSTTLIETAPPETETTTPPETTTTKSPETTTTTAETTTKPPETTTTTAPVTTTKPPVTTTTSPPVTTTLSPSTTIPLAAPVKPKIDEDAIFKGAAVTGLKMPSADGKSLASRGVGIIDYSNASEGYVMVKYDGKTSNLLNVRVSFGNEILNDYTGILPGEYATLPLSVGNGSYKITLMEIVNGKGSGIVDVTVDVKLTNDINGFTYPNFYANYNKDSKAVKIAAYLVKDIKDELKKIEAIYNYVITTYSYDYDYAKKVINKEVSYHVPDLENIVKNKKGICFDYAALMVSMLRSVGIPAKHIHGYAPDGKGTEVYHAWINTYTKETGWINGIIQFDGKNWKLMDPTYVSTTNSSDAGYKLIGDGSKYRNMKYF